MARTNSSRRRPPTTDLVAFDLSSITMCLKRSRITSSTRGTTIIKISHPTIICSCISRIKEAARPRNSKILTSGIRPLHRRIRKRSLNQIGAKANVGSNSLHSGPSLLLPVVIRPQEQHEEHQLTIKHLVVVLPLAETMKSRGSNLRRRRKRPPHSWNITTPTVPAPTSI